jgi:NAD(P)-dependent dehydrogenase (short-subunit alcohol dehydrogenase family)
MFTDTTVLLTGVGAEGQVGEIVAKAFAGLGASLVLVDRTLEHVEAGARAVIGNGGKAVGYACDLTDAAAVGNLASRVRAAHGDKLRAMVHMAGGFAMSGPVAESDVEVWHRQISINLTTAYLASRAFLPMLRADRGSLVFFASEAALPGASVANKAAYSVAKTGVVTLMRAIAAEERGSGVRANAIAPTSIRTAANIAAMGSDNRYIEREQVADVVTYLCSAGASAVNGAVVPLP